MEEVHPQQVFIRNDKGKIWGPLLPASVELLFDNGLIDGRVQVSLDGNNYVFPGRMPLIRTFIPRPLWGDVVVPGDDIEHPPPPPPIPGAAPASAAAAMAGQGSGGIRAGPGAVMNAAARNHAAMAGPGARAQMDKRFAPNMGQPVAAAQPGPPVVGPPVARPSAGPPPVVGPPVTAPRPVAPPPPAPTAAAPVHAPAPAAVFEPGTFPASGDLAQLPALHLYYLAASGDLTGLLTMVLADRQILIHFRKGNPEHVDSTHPDDALTTFLVRAQLTSYEQLGQAEAQKAKFGGELVGALFGLGILNPSTAFTHLGARATGILFRAFIAESGTFTWNAVDLPAHKAMPLGNRWAVLAEQVRRVPSAEIHRRMASFADHPVMKSGGRVASDQLRLTPQEARALSYFDGVHSIAQLAAAHPAEADHFFRVAWMLKDLEAVSFAAVKLAAPGPAAPAAPELEAEPLLEASVEPILDAIVDAVAEPAPTPPAPAPAPPPVITAPRPVITAPGPAAAAAPGPPKPGAPPRPVGSPGARPPPPTLKAAPGGPPPPTLKPAAAGPTIAPPPALRAPSGPLVRPLVQTSAPTTGHSGEFDGEIRQLQETLKKMKEQHFFEIFGLTTKADAGQIKMAYFKLAKLYHPDTIPPGAPEAYAKAKADIFARIGEANRTLVDDKARADYVADIDAGGTGADKIDVASLLAAEEMFQKGTILVKARKFPEAVKMLDEAIKSNPDEGEFYAWRAFAKFASTTDRKAGASEALKDFAVCNKKNPRCPALWFYQGQVAKLTGDLATAKRHFQKTVELQPDHIDAQRELRMMK